MKSHRTVIRDFYRTVVLLFALIVRLYRERMTMPKPHYRPTFPAPDGWDYGQDESTIDYLIRTRGTTSVERTLTIESIVSRMLLPHTVTGGRK